LESSSSIIPLPDRQENVIRFTFSLDGEIGGRQGLHSERATEDAAAKSRGICAEKGARQQHPQSDKSQLRSREIDLGIAQGGLSITPRV